MSYKIYWSEPHGIIQSRDFDFTQMSEALRHMQWLRTRPGVSHVCMSSENPNQIGKVGVDAVVDGKTPDGQDYTWSKQDRAGKMRRRDYENPDNVDEHGD